MSFIVPKLEDDDYSPEIIKERIKEITPDKKIDELPVNELDKAIHTAFEIIGYEPDNLENSINYAFENVRTDNLWDYIYTVWEADYGVI